MPLACPGPPRTAGRLHQKTLSAAGFGEFGWDGVVIILTIKWFATANLLNACPCLLTCGLWPLETILKGRRVSIYAGKWLAPVLTSYASSRADVANPRSQTMNVWTVSPIFIVGDHFVLRISPYQRHIPLQSLQRFLPLYLILHEVEIDLRRRRLPVLFAIPGQGGV